MTIVTGEHAVEVYREEQTRAQRRLGNPWLDRCGIGHLSEGALLTVGAETNVGKTYFLLHLMQGIVLEGGRPCLISCEDGAGEIGRRVVDWDMADKLYLSFPTRPALATVMELMAEAVNEHGCTHLLVDYLQVLLGDDPKLSHQRHNEVRVMVVELKALARGLGVPLVLASQLRRPAMEERDEPPNLHQLKESGDIANASEYVVLLWRQNARTLTAKLAKSKSTITGQRCTYVRGASGTLVEGADLEEEF